MIKIDKIRKPQPVLFYIIDYLWSGFTGFCLAGGGGARQAIPQAYNKRGFNTQPRGGGCELTQQ